MSDERILELIENQDKYYILGFIKGIKANNELLQQENKQLKEKIAYLERSNERKEETIIYYQINEYPVLEKLKNWLEEKIRYYKEIGYVNTSLALTMSLDKIKKIEEGVK